MLPGTGNDAEEAVMDEAEDVLPPGVSIQVNGGRKSGATYTNNILFQSVLRDCVRKDRFWLSIQIAREASLRRVFDLSHKDKSKQIKLNKGPLQRAVCKKGSQWAERPSG